MAIFNLHKISAAATGNTAYLRGIHYYNAGLVKALTRTESNLYAEIVTAEVDGAHPEACFDRDGALVQFECDCSSWSLDSGICKHIAAMLVYKYYSDMVSFTPETPTVARRREASTDAAAKAMIDRYMQRETAAVSASLYAQETPVRLVPTLRIGSAAATLTFSLRGERTLVLHDLRTFSRRMAEGETASYGKSLTLFHHPNRFFEADRPLLRFLLGQVSPSPRGDGALRELPLPPMALDAFFSVMRGRAVDCRVHGRAYTVSFEKGDPALTLTVRREGDGCVIEGDAALLSLSGVRRRYVLVGNILYGCSPEFGDRVGPLLDALHAGKGQLFIAKAELPAAAVSLSLLEDLVTLSGEVDTLRACLPDRPDAELYLDAPNSHTIEAKLLFCYGETRYNAYLPETAERCDTLTEYRLRALVEAWFTPIDGADGRLTMSGDDDRLYRFLTEGLSSLGDVAAIYVTDRVKAIGIAPPPAMSIGVRMDSGLLHLSLDLDGLDRAELAAILRAYKEKRSYHRLRSGQFLSLDAPSLQSVFALSEGLSISQKALQSGEVTLPAFRALYLDRVLRESPPSHMTRDDAFRRLCRSIRTAADNEFTPPASLQPVLRGYQKTGFRWLKAMQQSGFGGILADEMGLGKTVEMISLLLDAKEQGEQAPALVICPSSLVFNWQRELSRFAPSLRTLAVTGDAAAREELLRTLPQYDVIVTSYDLLKRDLPAYLPITFSFHVLDEAQYIKNAATVSAKTVKAIASRYRFALTGTPIENRLSELWSIFDFLMPGFLYSYSRFRDRFERPIVRDDDKQALSRLDRMVSPFILRRLKADVLRELPPKHESVVPVVLTGEQRTLYNAAVWQLKEELEARGLQKNRMTVLSLLTRLRQICCSPSLCFENYRAGSAKTDACLDLIRQAIDGGHKVLLFSQFTSLLDELHAPLAAAGIPYYELRGATSSRERDRLVGAFNKDDTPLFLISLKAGGTGLNLTGADVVIHFDPWWNLSAQNQATDRAHRIGQTHTVQVYRLIAVDTIEEKILALQEKKQALAAALIHEGDGILSGLSAEDLLRLLD